MTGLLAPGARCTAWWYASHRGFGYDLEFLAELGLRAARLGRWYGWPQQRVPEGPYFCCTWPEPVWDEAITAMAWMYGRIPGDAAASAAYRAMAMPDHSGPARAWQGDGPADPPGWQAEAGRDAWEDQDDEVIPPWYPLPQGDQALFAIGF